MLTKETVHKLPDGVHHSRLPRSLLLRPVLPLCGPDCDDACGSLPLDAGDSIEVVGVDPRGLHGTHRRETV